ncbi:hypothetical protein GCM10010399_66450 [Dactylosporangium fulvum]|uniref:Uncharacterized protein n=1 Tax=Dactylosporangium fulvum TaxID=53359 RepID=A0ABY5VV42_9ACTN|nr:hypothetical protein [Dactylosporangium fulvum]UWP81668.1 hypothetical protein Dfulv_42235 [Dactylosporangium fulvum]
MTYPPNAPDDEPRSQPFQPMSYDLAPEFGTPPPASNPPRASEPQYGGSQYGGPAAPTSGGYQQPGPAYPVSGGYRQPSPAYPVSGGYPPQPQPAYPGPAAQPVYPGPATASPVPQFTPPPKKGKGLKITLGVVGGVFLICAIAACVFLYPVFSESGAHVTAPPTLPGKLTKQDDRDMQKLVDQMENDLKTGLGTTDEVAVGIYSDGDLDKIVVLVAAASVILFPDTELDNAFKGFSTLGASTEYDPGKWGGTLKCATGTSDNTKMTMCAWADHGSLGIGVFNNRGESESAALFRDIRDIVQSRSN